MNLQTYKDIREQNDRQRKIGKCLRWGSNPHATSGTKSPGQIEKEKHVDH